jgi:hypothetical protein
MNGGPLVPLKNEDGDSTDRRIAKLDTKVDELDKKVDVLVDSHSSLDKQLCELQITQTFRHDENKLIAKNNQQLLVERIDNVIALQKITNGRVTKNEQDVIDIREKDVRRLDRLTSKWLGGGLAIMFLITIFKEVILPWLKGK